MYGRYSENLETFSCISLLSSSVTMRLILSTLIFSDAITFSCQAW